MKRRASRGRCSRWPGLAAAVGCATSPFQRAGNADDVGAALARSRPPAEKPDNAAGRNLAFLVLDGPAGPRLAAYDLGGRRGSCGRSPPR